jgi:DNA polymerase-1
MGDLSFEDAIAAPPGEIAQGVSPWSDAPARDSELFLIDGNNLAWKAFYAVKVDLSRSSDNLPTNALTGFANMLAKILSDYRPRAMVVAWDERPQRRLDVFPEYKANRDAAPEAMKLQFPHFERLASAFACINVRHVGCEADDVLATLARHATEKGIKSCVVTNDRDAYQLVNDMICILSSPTSLGDVRVYTVEKVIERLGVRPEQVPDYLGLKGDSGDNIPGVPGFGEKTSAQLIAEHGSLEAVLENIDKLKGKKRENLEAHADAARMSKHLATVECDLELECDLEEILATPRDFSQLGTILDEFEMFGLRQRLERRGL